VIPIDLYLDLTPVATERLSVHDDEGLLTPASWGAPPLGGGIDVAFSQFEALDLVGSFTAAQTTPRFDIALDWAPTLWMGELDAGVRVHVVRKAAGWISLDVDSGPGLRAELLAQPWWRDYAYAGIGAHVGLVAMLGPDHWHAFIGVRGSASLVPGGAQGVLDSSVQDLTWDYAPTAAPYTHPLAGRLGLRVGAGWR